MFEEFNLIQLMYTLLSTSTSVEPYFQIWNELKQSPEVAKVKIMSLLSI